MRMWASAMYLGEFVVEAFALERFFKRRPDPMNAETLLMLINSVYAIGTTHSGLFEES